ncbi:MAG: Tn3 family transposase [Methylocystis silviterrae]|uniref:Tn3 family transposase n=1 Tax=Methylocystis silviterrae TaxID=2743612 RepID=UPI003BD49CAE
MRRLAAYPKQNALAKTFREIGRLERPLFTVDWISDPAMRRRTTAGIKKDEVRNALARAMFFHRLGEIRDRTFENQGYRASGLNLVVSAVILWNIVYLRHAVAEPRSSGEGSVTICSLMSRRSAGSTSFSTATMFGRPSRYKTPSDPFEARGPSHSTRRILGRFCDEPLLRRNL